MFLGACAGGGEEGVWGAEGSRWSEGVISVWSGVEGGGGVGDGEVGSIVARGGRSRERGGSCGLGGARNMGGARVGDRGLGDLWNGAKVSLGALRAR